jgi:hypothetical protein
MGQLKRNSLGRDKAELAADYAVGPVIADGAGTSLATSHDAIVGLSAGDEVQVYASDFFHAAFASGTDVAATNTTPGPFAPGIYRWACPDAMTKVVMIQASGATAKGGAFKG